MNFWQIVASAFLCFFLTSCMVGPNWHKPCNPPVCRYTECPEPHQTVSTEAPCHSGKKQFFVKNADIPGAWWQLFHSPQLNVLICKGLANNPTLAAAKASLYNAYQNYLAQVGTLLPTINGNLNSQRQAFSTKVFGSEGANTVRNVFNLINANLSIAYTLDLFGGLRRQVEAAGAQVDYQQYELEAAFLTLSSNIVTTAITIASLRDQIKATQDLIKDQEQILSIVRKQFDLGSVALADVLTQETQLNQLRATLPPLQQNLSANLHTLSILIGEYPCQDCLPCFELCHFNLTSCLPTSCPSLLARNRPDVQAAEALLHVASAQIGVATANLYPQITITGNYGYQNDAFGGLFAPDNKIWSLATGITQPIFHGGTLRAQRCASIAAFQQAAAQYRETVLQAFKDVADVLRALQHDALLLKAQRSAEKSAWQSYRIVKQQLRLGGVNYLNLLTAERNYQQTKIARIKAQAARYADTATLFQALGGGWWNRYPIYYDPLLTHNVSCYKPECFN